MKRTLRMILMSNRRSEHRENPVAGRLRDVAAVTMDSVHHKLQYWVDDRAHLLGIEPTHQLGRVLNIRE